MEHLKKENVPSLKFFVISSRKISLVRLYLCEAFILMINCVQSNCETCRTGNLKMQIERITNVSLVEKKFSLSVYLKTIMAIEYI